MHDFFLVIFIHYYYAVTAALSGKINAFISYVANIVLVLKLIF